MLPSPSLPRVLTALAAAAALVPAVGAAQARADSCTYHVKGRLIVNDPTVDGISDGEALKGVEIKVSGRSSVGWYNEWADVRTGADGRFSVDKSECSARAVKVEARFKADDLHVSGPSSPNWYQLYETDGTVDPKTIDLGDEPFKGESGDQATNQARTDAQTWIFYRRAIDYLDDIGHPFLNRIVVHNPATLTSGISATDPILQDIHIDPKQTADLDTWAHELGHAWMYPHVTGEGCLTWDALISGDTHQSQESSCVAFNEGFAEYFANTLEREMNTAGLLDSTEGDAPPFNRARLSQTYGLDTLAEVAKQDRGWDDAFRVLTEPDITHDLFGKASGTPGFVGDFAASGCSGRPSGLDDLADALQVIGSDMDVSGVSVESFLGRADNRLSGFDSADAEAYLDAIDPKGTTEPHTAYGC